MSNIASSGDYLLDGPKGSPSDMHVQSGYPIWTLISVWNERGQSDEAVIQEYALDAQEWAAAKAYYFAHQREIDARRTLNNEPHAPASGAISLEDLLKQQSTPASQA